MNSATGRAFTEFSWLNGQSRTLYTGAIKLKTTLLLLAGITLVWIVLLIVFGFVSRSGKPPGLVDNKLAPCPDSPNCICTEYQPETKYFASPLQISMDNSAVMDEVQSVIVDMGGEITGRDQLYLTVAFRSRLFGLVDDFEIRWVPKSGLLHIRSGSRIGYGDLGVNRKRVDDFKNRYNALLKKKLST